MSRGTADTSLVKKAYAQHNYTAQELAEFTQCTDPVNGPMYFMENFMMIQHPTKGSIPFVAFDYQRDLVKSYHEYRRSINLCGRQMGKCVTQDTTIVVRSKSHEVYHTQIGTFYQTQTTKPRDINHCVMHRSTVVPTARNTTRSGCAAQVQRKFTDVVELSDEWEIHTDSGWQPLTHVNQTVEYAVWRLVLQNNMQLECADDHIVYLWTGDEIFVKDLVVGDAVLTEQGPVIVSAVVCTNRSEQMYDVTVNSADHRFYSNGILSHNTTTAAGYLLWYAMFKSDSTVLVAAHKAAGANEIMQRVRYAYENCPDHIRAGVVEYNKGSVTFDNGSRIVASTTTETTGRGMSISLIYCDEFAYVRSSIAKEFWTSLSPTLATGGKAIVTSTPNGDDDTFANIWRGALHTFDEYGNEHPDGLGHNGFKAYKAIWSQHPDRDHQWAEEEKASIGAERFAREHECEFIVFDETLLDSMVLSTLKGRDPLRRTGQVRWYKYPDPRNQYIVSLDPSSGTGGDPAAIQVLELPSMEQAAEWQHNKTPVEGQIRTMMEIMQYLKEMGVTQTYWSVENNTIGEAALVVIRDTGEENFPGDFINEPKKTNAGRIARRGFNTNNRNKIEACLMLKRLTENGRLTVHSKPLIKELKNFVARGNGFAAKPGENDDLVMSMLLALRMTQYVSTFEDSVYDAVNSNITNGMIDHTEDNDWDAPYPTMF